MFSKIAHNCVKSASLHFVRERNSEGAKLQLAESIANQMTTGQEHMRRPPNASSGALPKLEIVPCNADKCVQVTIRGICKFLGWRKSLLGWRVHVGA